MFRFTLWVVWFYNLCLFWLISIRISIRFLWDICIKMIRFWYRLGQFYFEVMYGDELMLLTHCLCLFVSVLVSIRMIVWFLWDLCVKMMRLWYRLGQFYFEIMYGDELISFNTLFVSVLTNSSWIWLVSLLNLIKWSLFDCEDYMEIQRKMESATYDWRFYERTQRKITPD